METKVDRTDIVALARGILKYCSVFLLDSSDSLVSI